MNTVSAPSGIGAPVKMRIASPGATGGPSAALPACSRPATRNSRASPLGTSSPAHGIAVDGRVRERRQLQRRDEVVGQHAAVGVGERDGFHFVDGAEARDDRGDRVLDGQYLRAGREAVLRELRHALD